MKNFEPVIELRDPKSLTPYANNSKIHTTEQIDKIAGQIAAVGFTQPIVVDKDGVIIAGHGRREAALRLNLKTVPVIVADHLDEYEIKAARIADNKVAEGDVDHDKLKFEIGSLERADFDLKMTAYSLGEIEHLLLEPSSSQSSREDSKDQEKERDEDTNEDKQFIVTLHCDNENQMKEIYNEMIGRGFECKLIT